MTPVLPKVLRGLSPEQVEELVDLAELKAWTRATEVEPFTPKELELIAKAEERGEKVGKGVRNRLYNPHMWVALRWYLFGGYVDLVGFQENPKRAYDPDTNPWVKLWVPGWARTKDEQDVSSPYKPMPDKDYLRLIAYAWVMEPLIAIPKSRQLMMTWLFSAIASWVVTFQDARRIGMISKKEEDADAILERVMTVYRGLPSDRFYVPEVKKKYTRIDCPEHDSLIQALSENPEGVRSFTYSWIFSDEVAFQDYAAEQQRAAMAAVKGGARYTLVTTSNGEEHFHSVITEGGRIPVPAGR